MVVGRHRGTKAVIDLGAIYDNVKKEISRLHDSQDLFAVVKANAYGHGLIPVASAAKKAGAAGFCVALIDEGLALRAAGFLEPVLILGLNDALEAPVMARYDLAVAVGDEKFLQDARPLLKQAGLKLRVHLALDTGMGRIGFRTPTELKAVIKLLEQYSDAFIFEGIFTHFASADSSNQEYYVKQIQSLDKMLAVVDNKPRYVHFANTAAAIWHQRYQGNMVRYGIGMYGLNPSGHELADPVELKPALQLVSELVAVRQIKPGDSVGYGHTYTAESAEWIGTVPIGYADGWARKMQGFSVLINGNYCEIVGRVCMDQFMVRLPHKFDLQTKVTLIGDNGGKTITAQQVADYAQTIHYEVITALTERVQRIYVWNNR